MTTAIEETLLRATQNPAVRQAITQYCWWWRTYRDPVEAVEFAGDFLSTDSDVEEFTEVLAILL